MEARREPVRTCVGCRRTATKRELLRVVRAPDGSVGVDPTGKAAGRGVYVHRDPACMESAFARGALLRALRAGAPLDGAARLQKDMEEALRG